MGARSLLLAAAVSSAGCVVFESGPLEPDRYPPVEGRWDVIASPISSSCGFVSDEPFTASVVRNRDLLQLVVEVSGFGEVRYDGRVEVNGRFVAGQSTVYPAEALRDDSTVEGTFDRGGRDLRATETEFVTDLWTGRTCSVVWRWQGERR